MSFHPASAAAGETVLMILIDDVTLFVTLFIKPQLVTARLRLHASLMSICLSICLSVCRQNAKKRDFLKN